MSQPYAGYGAYQAGWPPGGYASYGYDYSSYYQQPQQPYDASYAAWYSQQQQQAPAAGTAGGIAPPNPPPAAPPLPAEAPPPLPPGSPPEEPQPSAAGAAAATTAGGTGAATASQQPADSNASNAAATQQQQYASYYQGGQYDAYSQYPGYGGYGSSYATTGQPSYASYNYSTGQYGSSSTNPYASQVPQASANPPSASASVAAGAAASPAVPTPAASDYNRMPPPASLAAPRATARQATVIPGLGVYSNSAAATGSNATPLGGGGGSSTAIQQPSSLEAMKAAAAAVASRLTAGQPAGRPQYVQAAAASVPQQHQQQQDGSRDLPTSLQQYVARSLALLGKTNETRLELRTVLRDMIAKAKKDGTMWSTDWDREPLPVLSSQAHLSSAVAAAGSKAQQEQPHTANVWDRLGGRDRGRDREDEHRSQWGSRKRGRDDQQHSDSSHSSDEDERYGSYSARKKNIEVHGSGKKQQQQQDKKKGKKGKKQQQQQQRWDDEWDAEEQAKHAARSARFAGGGGHHRNSTLAAYGWDDDAAVADAAAAGEFVVGTCQTLEKRYFRLTKAPSPSEVRPQPVLQLALQRLLGMVVRKEDKYLYYNDQFKAMRQDLTVQGIKNEFTVQVYEAHARAALEYGDSAEYNQCQTQLAILYAAGLPGSHAEFSAYRLLYQSVHAAAGEGRRLLGTMKQLLGNKVGQVADSLEVQHAMQVRQALASSNVTRFFRLYACAPRLGRCLMDVAVKQLRWKGLNTLVRAHKPGTLPLPFLATTLGFLLSPEEEEEQQEQRQPPRASPGVFRLTRQLAALTVDESGTLLPGCSERSCTGDNATAVTHEEGLQACLEWCKRHGAVFDSEADLSTCCLLTKECWQRLFIPEDTTKVAHGDVNLDIRDFLAL